MKQKVAHIIYTKQVGGAERYLNFILTEMQSIHFEFSLIIVTSPQRLEEFKAFYEPLRQKGILLFFTTASKWSILNVAYKINTFLKQNQIKYLHSHLLGGDAIAALIKVLFYKKLTIISTKHGYKESVVQHYHQGVTAIKKDLYYYINKAVLKPITYNIAVSKAVAALYHDLGYTTKPYDIIYHGVPQPSIAIDNHNARFASQQIIMVGRFEEVKGHKYAIEAMQYVVQHYPKCKLILVGEGSLTNKMKLYADQLGLSQSIEFLGYKPNPANYVINSDIILLPSLFEPFGLVYLEAFALKKPIVAFNVPACNEITQNNYTALLVQKQNSKELANAIVTLFSDPILADKIAINGYNSYLQSFTVKQMAENTLDWYKKNII